MSRKNNIHLADKMGANMFVEISCFYNIIDAVA